MMAMAMFALTMMVDFRSLERQIDRFVFDRKQRSGGEDEVQNIKEGSTQQGKGALNICAT